MRKLIWVPTIHGLDETSPIVSDAVRLDIEVEKRLLGKSDMLWQDIYRGFDELNLDFKGIKVFAEGETQTLPVQDNPIPFDIAQLEVNKLYREKGIDKKQTGLVTSLNHAGAVIMQTEDGSLLTKLIHYYSAYHRTVLGNDTSNNLDEVVDPDTLRQISIILEGIKVLNKEREMYIVSSIHKGLEEEETGILVLGLEHDIRTLLPNDISVEIIHPELIKIVDEIRHEFQPLRDTIDLLMSDKIEGYGIERRI